MGRGEGGGKCILLTTFFTTIKLKQRRSLSVLDSKNAVVKLWRKKNTDGKDHPIPPPHGERAKPKRLPEQ